LNQFQCFVDHQVGGLDIVEMVKLYSVIS